MEKLSEFGLYVLVSFLHGGLTADDFETRQFAQQAVRCCSLAGFPRPLNELRKCGGDLHFHHLLDQIRDGLSGTDTLPTKFALVGELRDPPRPEIYAGYLDRFRARTSHFNAEDYDQNYFADEIRQVSDELVLEYAWELIEGGVCPRAVARHIGRANN